MKLLIFSDIHGFAENLLKLKELDEKENFDKIIALGDLYYPGPTYDKQKPIDSALVHSILTGFGEKLFAVRGNCDSDVDVKASDFPMCSELMMICDNGLDLYFTHGNVYSPEKNRKFLGRRGVMFWGHKHIPEISQDEFITYVNVGSISFPKNQEEPTYAVYENRKVTIFSVSEEEKQSIDL